MDTSEFFNTVVKRNYQEFTRNPDDFRSLWNAIISMNTVPEYMALDRHGYAAMSRDALAQTANQIRNKHQSLIDVKFCAETLKHVRKIPPKNKQGSFTITVSSKRRPQESEQDDKWSFCLTAGTLCPANQERQ